MERFKYPPPLPLATCHFSSSSFSLSIDMLSRSKSIFHLGDLEEDGGVSAKGTVMSSRGLMIRCINKRASDEVEGLRILINQRDEAANYNVVIKASLKTANKLNDCHLPKGLPDFLASCCLCKKELSPCKDVYMYRGDQGFCSKECRSRQILLDERREFEMATRKRSRAPRHRISSPKILESDRYRRLPALLT